LLMMSNIDIAQAPDQLRDICFKSAQLAMA